jgi:hypothetical protein
MRLWAPLIFGVSLAGRPAFGYTTRHGGQGTEIRHIQVL